MSGDSLEKKVFRITIAYIAARRLDECRIIICLSTPVSFYEYQPWRIIYRERMTEILNTIYAGPKQTSSNRGTIVRMKLKNPSDRIFGKKILNQYHLLYPSRTQSRVPVILVSHSIFCEMTRVCPGVISKSDAYIPRESEIYGHC